MKIYKVKNKREAKELFQKRLKEFENTVLKKLALLDKGYELNAIYELMIEREK